MDINLKPCPFCGCDMIAAEICCERGEFRIYCQGGDPCCLAEMTLAFGDAGILGYDIDFGVAQKVMDEMIDAWNRRADDGQD